MINEAFSILSELWLGVPRQGRRREEKIKRAEKQIESTSPYNKNVAEDIKEEKN